MNNKIINVAHTLIDVSQIAAIQKPLVSDNGKYCEIPIILKGGYRIEIYIKKESIPAIWYLEPYAYAIRNSIINEWSKTLHLDIYKIPEIYDNKSS